MLKDCPFCGERPKYSTQKEDHGQGRVQIHCGHCGGRTKTFGNVSDANDAWNLRIAEDLMYPIEGIEHTLMGPEDTIELKSLTISVPRDDNDVTD